MGNDKSFSMLTNALCVPWYPLPHNALCSVRSVAISTVFTVQTNEPATEVPQCATVSDSK